MNSLLVMIGVAGFVFFFVRWVQLQLGYQNMSEVERRYAEILATTESQKLAEEGEKSTLSQRRAALLNRWGMKDSLFPVFAVLAFSYLTLAALMTAAGLDITLAAILPIPVGFFLVLAGSRLIASKRKDRFNRQLVDLLDLLAGQLRAGVGMDRAMVNVLPSLQEPIRAEIDQALRIASSGGDMLEALSDIRNRYPSRSLDLFLSLLAIDRDEGASITPALEQASDIMKNAFTLQSEGRAELSSSKAEFYGVFGIVMGLSLNSLLNADSAGGGNVWLSPIGIMVLVLLAANTSFGVWRFSRVMSSLKKETE